MEENGIGRPSTYAPTVSTILDKHYVKKNGKYLVITNLGRAVTEWMEQAKRGDHTALMDSNLKKIYTDAYYRRSRWMVPILGAVTRPKSYDRFLRQAEACLTHYAWERLCSISAPTLVIGGEEDHCLGAEASREIAAQIPGAVLKMYPGQGHGLYEEARDFNDRVLEFLK